MGRRINRLIFVTGFGVSVSCGGQTEGAPSLGRFDSSTGGVVPSSNPTLVGGSSVGGSSVGGSSVGGSSVGGSTGADCSGDSIMSVCVAAHTGGSAAASTSVSSGDNSCLSPATRTYVKGDNYAGYAFSFISLGPTYGDNLDCSITGAGRLCTSGAVGRCISDACVGAIGINLNQSSVPDSPANPVSQKIDSVTVAYAASVDSGGGFRVQVNQGTTYYCYQVGHNPLETLGTYKGTITIPADQFTSTCWCLYCSGDVWDGTGATGVQLIAVNSDSVPMDYDVCLNSLSINLKPPPT